MGSNIPDGFAEYAIDKPYRAVMAQFGLARAVTLKMLQAMPDDWKAQRDLTMRAIKSEGGRRGGAKLGTADPKPVTPKRVKPTLEQFYLAALTMPQKRLGETLHIGTATIFRYMKRLSPEQRQAVKDASIERRKDSVAKTLEKAWAANAEKHAARAAARPPKSAKVKTLAKRPQKAWGFNKSFVPEASGSHVALAMQHLRRHYRNVCRGETIRSDWRGIYVVGNMKLPEADMLALARSYGWRLGSFLEVAA